MSMNLSINYEAINNTPVVEIISKPELNACSIFIERPLSTYFDLLFLFLFLLIVIIILSNNKFTNLFMVSLIGIITTTISFIVLNLTMFNIVILFIFKFIFMVFVIISSSKGSKHLSKFFRIDKNL